MGPMGIVIDISQVHNIGWFIRQVWKIIIKSYISSKPAYSHCYYTSQNVKSFVFGF